jgi:transcriptional regulator with XRE-family HTH domain
MFAMLCAVYWRNTLPGAILSARILEDMAIKPKMPLGHLLSNARRLLGMSQAQFGPALGASHRTAVRWDAGKSYPGEGSFRTLARLLAPLDRGLAAEAAANIGETLVDLGIVEPPPVETAPPPRSPPEDLVDALLCAAANQAGAVPETMRPVLYAVFRRAREVGLSVDEVERVLAPAPEGGATSARDSAARASAPQKP